MFNVNAMAKKQKGRLVNNFIFSSRDKYFKQILFPNEVLKSMRLLQKGENLLYLPDQDYGYDHSIFVPFFNIPTLTVKFPSIAKKRAECKVYFLYLEDIKNRYKINLKQIGNDIWSYDTRVAEIKDDKLYKLKWNVRGMTSSPTTSKHINYVANELGLTIHEANT